MRALVPGYLQFYSHQRPLKGEQELLKPNEFLSPRERWPEGYYETIQPQEPMPPVIEVNMIIPHLDEPFFRGVLRALGYHRVSVADPWREVWARGWVWPIALAKWQGRRPMWAALRWAFDHRLVSIKTPESVMVSLNDFRPAIGPWRAHRMARESGENNP